MTTTATAFLIFLAMFSSWAAAMGFVHRDKHGFVFSAILAIAFFVAAIAVGRFM